MTTDPRLSDVSLLALAALRVQHRQARQVSDWRHTEGLAALLECARALPQRGPWDLPALDDSGLGRLLKDARARQQEAQSS